MFQNHPRMEPRWGLLLASLIPVWLSQGQLCELPCVNGQCEGNNCSCEGRWAGPQCTEDRSSCASGSHNCIGFVVCDFGEATSCTNEQVDSVHIGQLGRNFSITLEYSARECNGVLAYGKGSTLQNYYIILEVLRGTVRFIVNDGAGGIILSSISDTSSDPYALCNGQWISVKAIRSNNIYYLETSKGKNVTFSSHINQDASIPGENVDFYFGKRTETTMEGSPLNGLLRNIVLVNARRKWSLPSQLELPANSSKEAKDPKIESNIVFWICIAVGILSAAVICICGALNIVLISIMCHYKQKQNRHKGTQKLFPSSQLNLFPPLEIDDGSVLDNNENPTSVTFMNSTSTIRESNQNAMPSSHRVGSPQHFPNTSHEHERQLIDNQCHQRTTYLDSTVKVEPIQALNDHCIKLADPPRGRRTSPIKQVSNQLQLPNEQQGPGRPSYKLNIALPAHPLDDNSV